MNRSTTADAFDVQVTVSFTDTVGRTVLSRSSDISVIPAATRFYFGGGALSNVSLTVASFQATVKVESSKAKRIALPTVSGVVVSSKRLRRHRCRGSAHKPLPAPLPASADIHAVVFDSQGRVIGGTSQPTLAQVQPGASAAFRLDYFDLYPVMTGVTAQVSVDPCGGLSFDCAVIQP